MVQSFPEDTRELGRRERNRLARYQSYLRCAFEVVGRDGLDGLTMQRLADELDCAVGTVYTYFPSKSALVAELQREAIERLTASLVVHRAALDQLVAERGVAEPVALLARAVGVGRFWAALSETYPEEAHLLQLLMSETRSVLDPDDGIRNLPAALRHLDQARAALATARDAGLLEIDDVWERVVTWVAAINGVVQVSRLQDYDEELFRGEALADRLNRDLFRAWGADPAVLAGADALVDELAARGPLAPPVPAPDPPRPTTGDSP